MAVVLLDAMAQRKGARLAKVGPKGGISYAQEFVEAVVAYAFKHTNQEAADYFELPVQTVGRWARQHKKIAEELSKRHVAQGNPYRGGKYGIDKRMKLSDKLFAEVEHTIEVVKLKRGGYVPPEDLQRLINAYSALVDKRRLEEGVHTALVQAVKDPEEIYEEGEAKVVEFRKRHALPSGS